MTSSLTVRWARVTTLVTLLLALEPAHASQETLQLSYATEGEGCPSWDGFIAELRARSDKVVFGVSGRRFSVSIVQGQPGFLGELSIEDGAAPPSVRTITGTDCAEVASALGLIVALAMDPEAKTAPRAELELPLPATESSPVAGAERPAAPEPPPPVAPVTPAVAPRRRAQVPSSPGAHYAWAVGAGAAALSGPAPRWLLAWGPELELSRRQGDARQALGVALRFARSDSLGPSVELASFELLAAKLSLAPLVWAQRWRARVALELEAGQLSVEGREIPVGERQQRPWVDAGLGGRLGYGLLPWLALDAVAGLRWAITQDHFVFERPRRSVYQVPGLVLEAGLGLLAHLP